LIVFSGNILPLRELLLSFFVAATVTFLLTGPVRALATRCGAVAWPRGRDVHVTPTPRWGGIAIFGGTLAGLGIAYQLPALRLAYDYSNEVPGVALAALLLVAVGALDDFQEMGAGTKLLGQVAASGVVVMFGVQWTMIWQPWGGNAADDLGSVLILGQAQGFFLTVLLTVAVINAMNFIDGLDGLAAGVGVITCTAIAVFSLGLVRENGNDPSAYSPALLGAVAAGACLGFLPHNSHPARIFMGDSGSMLIGLLLSACVTGASGRIPVTSAGISTLALLMPVIVLVGVIFVPVLDLLMAVVRRTRAGTSPFHPDKKHLHHRLIAMGHSHRRAVALIYLWSSLVSLGTVAFALSKNRPAVLAVIGVCVVAVAAASFVKPVLRRLSAAGPGA
jgi:UDP-GlcNAc:undecaprenyl-phosphate GlcNAc-1-phosphate transferase